jgi:nucleotide-binding universal stress UspA family protein
MNNDPNDSKVTSGPTDLVVVGYDGSVQADAAVDWAAEEARHRRSKLLVTSVSDASWLTDSGLGTEGGTGAGLQAAQQLVQQGVARATKAVPDLEVVTSTSHRHPAEVLVEQSREAAMLVLGASGHSALAGTIFGSVAHAAVSHAGCPVVVVRGDCAHRPGPDGPVVVGVDGSESCRDALGFAAGVAAGYGAPLTLVHAWRSVSAGGFAGEYWQRADPGTDPDAGGEARSRNLLQQVAADLREQYPELTVRTSTVQGDPRGALSVAAGGAALLVVGARGLGGFSGLILGSVSHSLVSRAPCPVAVVHQQR